MSSYSYLKVSLFLGNLKNRAADFSNFDVGHFRSAQVEPLKMPILLTTSLANVERVLMLSKLFSSSEKVTSKK